MIPKSRLDALIDCMFAVSMTLLVIDLPLPETFHPQNSSELLQQL
ncbi:MAG: TMEM175 family protein [Pseudomonadota bacterium]